MGPGPYKTKIMLPSCSFQCIICLCPWSLDSGDNTQREVQCSGFHNDYLFVSLIFWSILFGFVYLFLFHPYLEVNTRSNILFYSLEVDACSIFFEESNNN